MSFKEEIYLHCHQLVDERVTLAQKLIDEAQTAANQDTKSSMGDKYETSREMMALEMRKAGEQLQESLKLKQVLNELKVTKPTTRIALGSLVSTSIGDFYLSISLGQIQVQNKKTFILSAVSPLGRELIDRKVGDEFEFNARQIIINSIA